MLNCTAHFVAYCTPGAALWPLHAHTLLRGVHPLQLHLPHLLKVGVKYVPTESWLSVSAYVPRLL